MVNDDPIRPYFSPSVQEMGLDRLAPVVHRPPVREYLPRKKCGKCSQEKISNSFTKEQWKVAKNNERECKVCVKYGERFSESMAALQAALNMD